MVIGQPQPRIMQHQRDAASPPGTYEPRKRAGADAPSPLPKTRPHAMKPHSVYPSTFTPVPKSGEL
jgi:hypothetical protein